MKPITLVLFSLVIFSLPAFGQDASVAAEGVEWKDFEEAVALAKTSDKKIVVDIYAPWCPWCRKLQTNVYADAEVQAYLSKHFIATRLDGDDSDATYQFKEYSLKASELAAGLGAEGYPTTVFLAGNSDYITRLPGFVDAAEFLQILQYIGSDAFKDGSYEDFVQAKAAK